MKTKLRFGALLASVAIFAAACGGSAATPAPGTPGPATPAPTSDGSTPTDEPQTTLTGNVVVWHAYGSSGGNAEFKAFQRVLDNVMADNPGLTIEALDVPFEQIFTKFQTESAAGGGPDLFIAPNDPFGDMVRGGFLVDLTGKIDDVLAEASEVAVGGATVDGKVYMVPESLKAVAMYYDTEKVPNPPKTTAELLQFVKDGGKVGVIDGAYFGWGFYRGFGGSVFDADGKCAATANSGVADGIAFVRDLRDAGALVDADYGKVNDAFKNGEIDIIFNGNWTLGDYRAARPGLAVAPVPAGPGGASATMTGVDGFYINSSGQNPDLAIGVAKALVSKAAQEVYVDVAGHVPANKNISIIDPLVEQFAQAIYTGDPRPQSKEFGGYWGPFGDAWRQVLDAGIDPATAVGTACTTMDAANNK
jgi:arabinogalactan oligomer / maltooligosaccharide transport system substrate-binding protein